LRELAQGRALNKAFISKPHFELFDGVGRGAGFQSTQALEFGASQNWHWIWHVQMDQNLIGADWRDVILEQGLMAEGAS
jgi:hypothetical protein